MAVTAVLQLTVEPVELVSREESVMTERLVVTTMVRSPMATREPSRYILMGAMAAMVGQAALGDLEERPAMAATGGRGLVVRAILGKAVGALAKMARTVGKAAKAVQEEKALMAKMGVTLLFQSHGVLPA